MNKKLFLCAALIISCNTTTLPIFKEILGASFDTTKHLFYRFKLNAFSAILTTSYIWSQGQQISKELVAPAALSFVLTDILRSTFSLVKKNEVKGEDTSTLSLSEYVTIPSTLSLITGSGLAGYIYYNHSQKN